MPPDQWILHADMDEFYAAVERLDDPTLAGKPILVGSPAALRGVVSTASYEARRFGCHSAMPMGRALRLCPQAVVQPVRMDRYEEVSQHIQAIFARYTPLVEPLSLDEAFLDLTGTERLFGPATEVGRRIKAEVRGELGLIVSVGIGPNKFLAKLASDLEKPDGFTVIEADQALTMLAPLPVGTLWGVGPVGEAQLHRLGIATIGQLRQRRREELAEALGDNVADHLISLAHGRDDRPVVSDQEAQSLGIERTFPQDIGDPEELRRILLDQVDQLARRLRQHQRLARRVTVKLRDARFQTMTRSHTLTDASDLTQDLLRVAQDLLAAWMRSDLRPLRLLGLTLSELDASGARQLSLFDDGREKAGRLDGAVDALKARFGDASIRRGSLLDSEDQEHQDL